MHNTNLKLRFLEASESECIFYDHPAFSFTSQSNVPRNEEPKNYIRKIKIQTSTKIPLKKKKKKKTNFAFSLSLSFFLSLSLTDFLTH